MFWNFNFLSINFWATWFLSTWAQHTAAIKHILQKTQTQLMNEYWLTLSLHFSSPRVHTATITVTLLTFIICRNKMATWNNLRCDPSLRRKWTSRYAARSTKVQRKDRVSFNKHAEANVHLCADKEEMRGKEGRQHVMCSSRVPRALRSRYICSTEDAG